MTRRRLLLRVAAATLTGVAAFAALGWYFVLREVPQPEMSDAEFFKYGSIGVEAASGLPYEIWRVLPSVFADRLPGGGTRPAEPERAYARFGFLFEDGRPTPIGFSVKRVGFERVGINCALCHAASLRTEPDSPARIVLGAPSTTIDLQGYLRFLFAAADDPRFEPETLLAAMQRGSRLSAGERVLFRHLVIPQTRNALRAQQRRMAFMDRAAPWGPGRQDPFNPAKIQLLGLPYDGSLGASDIMPLWSVTGSAGAALHWDGLNTSLEEVFLNSAIGNGADAKSIDLAAVARVRRFVASVRPPPYPFPVDASLAAAGRRVFRAHCAACHEPGEGHAGTTIPARALGTDPFRMQSWTRRALDGFARLDDYAWRYRHFRETDGYKAVDLAGIWSRAPYLHNGSVPSLTALLAPPERRPSSFYRGDDVYDPARVGFRSDGEQAARRGWRYDTRERGNSNQGHLYGTGLADADKLALVEYLKLR